MHPFHHVAIAAAQGDILGVLIGEVGVAPGSQQALRTQREAAVADARKRLDDMRGARR